jgi:hypothetical protein
MEIQMKAYLVMGNRSPIVTNQENLVKELRKQSFNKTTSEFLFKRATARACKIMSSAKIRIDENFVTDLIDAGFVKETEVQS